MMLKRVWHLARHVVEDVARIVVNEPLPARRTLLAMYLKLRARQLASRRRGSRHALKPLRARVFDFDVSFLDYPSLILMFSEVFVRKEYEFITTSERPFIIDAGSNIGLATLYFKRRYPGARVVAFEPEPTAFALLETNVRNNDLRDVELVNAALGGKRGHVALFHRAASPISSVRTQRGPAD